MPTQCSADLFGFAPVEGRRVEAGFDGGRLCYWCSLVGPHAYVTEPTTPVAESTMNKFRYVRLSVLT